jgi:hypothetical protein
MKQLFLLTALAVLPWASANAVDFNKDALKAMQQEGHKIVEEANAGKPFKFRNLCLDTAGAGLVVRACKEDAATQKWRFDDQSRLVADNGKCVAGAQLQNCGPGNVQKWTHDNSKRLSNAAKQCLQVQGDAPKAGAKVVAVACSDSPNQVWQ